MNTRHRQPDLLLSLLLAGVILATAGCGAKRAQPSAATSITPTSPALQDTPMQPATSQPLAVATETARSVFMPQVVSEAGTAAPAVAQPPTASATATPSPIPPPSPTSSPIPDALTLADWPALSLTDWPRPANDNGLCMHNITEQYYDEQNLSLQISRLKEMNIRWTVLLYGDENMLKIAAPMFRDAGITVIWRKMLRPYERYYDWGRDIQVLRDLGMEPYMQIYNEPSLPAEWDNKEIDQAGFMENFISAAAQVYNAGGYVGVQTVDNEWLVQALDEIKRRDGEKIFGRMFLIPHPYGLNHPPDYVEDPDGVLGFLQQAKVVSDTIGFVPPMIAGEGGWKWNATDDSRFPPIDAERHRDYHLEVFNWFRTGQLSNGQALPDTLFAFCPWLLSSKLDDSAWFDSFYGDHTPTVDAVKALPAFQRKFSWER